ncbi:hypothetical protein F5Y17DRAFT_426622 [Xylariaceae sp. FL0594]|nr:hypothetical protein F5Y17DRAFT_426622 [Xylariaceae sp. FL0594]
MLEYFTIKKLKKHRDEKAGEEQKAGKDKHELSSEAASGASAVNPDKDNNPQITSKPQAQNDDAAIEGTPVLDHEDEEFLKRLTSGDLSVPGGGGDDDDTPPPLPPRVQTPIIEIDSDTSSVASKEAAVDEKDKSKEKEEEESESEKETGKGKGKGKAKEANKSKRFSFVTNLPRSLSIRRKPGATTSTASGLEPDPNHLAVPSSSANPAVVEAEAASEKNDMARVLDDLNLLAKNNRVFSLSAETAETVRRFTQVLKDLVNGVPTAYNDLVKILEDRDGILARNYEKLPKSLKKLIMQLPEKLTSSLAPELLAAAAEAQGLTPLELEVGAEAGSGSGLKQAAKKFLMSPSNLKDLVTKPGALVGMLKGIVNALKTRFPAFVGTNVLWSLAVFLLLSMLWYCYKRGREVRLEREASEAGASAAADEKVEKTDETIDGQPRVEELPDDLQLPAASGKDGGASKGDADGKE